MFGVGLVSQAIQPAGWGIALNLSIQLTESENAWRWRKVLLAIVNRGARICGPAVALDTLRRDNSSRDGTIGQLTDSDRAVVHFVQ